MRNNRLTWSDALHRPRNNRRSMALCVAPGQNGLADGGPLLEAALVHRMLYWEAAITRSNQHLLATRLRFEMVPPGKRQCISS